MAPALRESHCSDLQTARAKQHKRQVQARTQGGLSAPRPEVRSGPPGAACTLEWTVLWWFFAGKWVGDGHAKKTENTRPRETQRHLEELQVL